jgi:formimidoylglutamate deiminase
MTTLFARNVFAARLDKEYPPAVDAQGDIQSIENDATVRPGEPQATYVLPGMCNLHSHAFQRAMAGMTEIAGDSKDSFWTWRDLMYRYALHITPEQIQAIAAQLYAECLRHGYTAVCEFHYLHRDPAGKMYAIRRKWRNA